MLLQENGKPTSSLLHFLASFRKGDRHLLSFDGLRARNNESGLQNYCIPHSFVSVSHLQ